MAGLQRQIPRPIQLHEPRRQPIRRPAEEQEERCRFAVARGNENLLLHDNWRRERAEARHGFADREHQFRHQGSADLNLYKLFLEAVHALLKLGSLLRFVVPSGLCSDNGTGALRRLFLERCWWEWLFGIENKDTVFPIRRSYKFNPVTVQKGGVTEGIRTGLVARFMQQGQPPPVHLPTTSAWWTRSWLMPSSAMTTPSPAPEFTSSCMATT